MCVCTCIVLYNDLLYVCVLQDLLGAFTKALTSDREEVMEEMWALGKNKVFIMSVCDTVKCVIVQQFLLSSSSSSFSKISSSFSFFFSSPPSLSPFLPSSSPSPTLGRSCTSCWSGEEGRCVLMSLCSYRM